MVEESQFRLLTRQNCHLCHEAELDLSASGIEFEIVDVDTDPELLGLYGDFVPVLLLGITEIARAPIIGSEVAARLNLLQQPPARL